MAKTEFARFTCFKICGIFQIGLFQKLKYRDLVKDTCKKTSIKSNAGLSIGTWFSNYETHIETMAREVETSVPNHNTSYNDYWNTHNFLGGEEATGGSASLDVRHFVVEEVEELVGLVVHLLPLSAALRPEQVAQVHRVDRRARLLVQLKANKITIATC